ncbi:MAG: hypothetical protein AAF502_18710 [Bacteroidota bacterium]
MMTTNNFKISTIISILMILLIAFTGCVKDEVPVIPTPVDNNRVFPQDPTDYLADRGSIYDFYKSNPQAYFGQFGVPPLARLGRLNESLGGNPFSAFKMMQAFYNDEAFIQAVEQGFIHPEFAQVYIENLNSNPFAAIVLAFLTYTDQMDVYLNEGLTEDPNVLLIYQIFTEVVTYAFDPAMFDALAPIPEKEYVTPLPENGIDALGFCGMDSFTEVLCQNPVNNEDDNDTSTDIDWDDVSSIPWKTTYNGACATLATGACAAKLGILDDDVNCSEWNDLSEDIGATPGKIGAPISGINDYFEGEGYGVSEAWDGWSESAVEEAEAALGRGCDVMLYYESADGTAAHIEVVTDIDVDGSDDTKGTITTLSWGRSATTTYDSGSYSDKSDGNRYRQAGENKSYLEGTGKAKLIYYCKE